MGAKGTTASGVVALASLTPEKKATKQQQMHKPKKLDQWFLVVILIVTRKSLSQGKLSLNEERPMDSSLLEEAMELSCFVVGSTQ